jgi:hypothetical protein
VLWLAAKRWARKAPCITFLAGTEAIVRTFLAGTELDPNVFRNEMERIRCGRSGWFLLIHVLVRPKGRCTLQNLRQRDIKEAYRIVKPMRYESVDG